MTASRYQHPLRWAGEQIDTLLDRVDQLEQRLDALESKPKRGRPRKPVSKPAVKAESLPMG